MIYVLDTSVIGFLRQEHPATMRQADEALAGAGNEVLTTVVTVSEQISGWLPYCRRAQGGHEMARAYGDLQGALTWLQSKKWLPFDEAAIFDQLRAQKVRIGTNDLAIAAIALSVNAVMVTRNIVDFQRVPNLIIEDWTH